MKKHYLVGLLTLLGIAALGIGIAKCKPVYITREDIVIKEVYCDHQPDTCRDCLTYEGEEALEKDISEHGGKFISVETVHLSNTHRHYIVSYRYSYWDFEVDSCSH